MMAVTAKTMEVTTILIRLLLAFILMMLYGMTDPTAPPSDINNGVTTTSEPKLIAIFSRETGRVAVINNQFVQIGDQLADGSRISKIEKDTVELINSKNKSVVLGLPVSIRKDEG
jgi:hypothetical protein